MTAYGEVGESSARHQLIGDSFAGFWGKGLFMWEAVQCTVMISHRELNIHFTQCAARLY